MNKDINKLGLFYIIATLYTWTIGFLIIANVLPLWTHYLAAWGPMLGAIAILMIYSNERKMFKTRFNFKKLLLPLTFALSPAIITGLWYFWLWINGDFIPAFSLVMNIDFISTIGYLALPLWMFTFGIGEEIGWRGFMYPKLREKINPIYATLIVWVLWSLWQLPFYYYLPLYLDMSLSMFVGLSLILFSTAFFLSWLYEKGKNILLPILWNSLYSFFALSALGDQGLAMVISMAVILMSIFIFIKWLIEIKKNN